MLRLEEASFAQLQVSINSRPLLENKIIPHLRAVLVWVWKADEPGRNSFTKANVAIAIDNSCVLSCKGCYFVHFQPQEPQIFFFYLFFQY